MVQISGGDKLEAALKRISEGLHKAASVSIGFQGGARYPDGTLVALVAALNEYGVPSHGQPPRPFFRTAIEANRDKWPINLMTALRNTDYDAEQSLGMLGQEIQEEIQQAINQLTSPPLAASTIARKGFDKPLIDDSVMVNGVTHVVKT